MVTGETTTVVLASLWIIDLDVLGVSLAQLLNGLLDEFDTAILSHGLGGIVSVGASAVPVTGDWLWIKCDDDAKLFSNAMQNVTTNPEMIASINAFTWADLEFPLGGHDLTVDTADLDSGVEASLVVSLYHIAAI